MKHSIAFILMICLSASSALAAKKKAPDVYPATEDTPSEEVISSAPGYSPGNSLINSEDVPPAPPAPIKVTSSITKPVPIAKAPPAPSSAPIVASTSTRASKYDSVPSTQAEPLLRRLRLTEELISKYGRAYDYRELTVTQLQAILGELDGQAAQASELKRRVSARAEMKKTIQSAPAEEIPAPAPESTNSIGSEAPESAAPFQGGGTGADSLAPPQN